MNIKFHGFLTLSAVLLWVSLAGCKGNTAADTTSDTGHHLMDSLSRDASIGNGNIYRMKIESQPDIIVAGKQVVFSLTPQIVGKETEPVPLDAERGYEIHLIMVSNDLSWFDHRHPGLSDLGMYEQAYTFNKGGTYILYAGYKPTGSKDTFQMKSFGVNGSAVLATTYTEPKLTSAAGPFEVSISPEQSSKIESGYMQHLKATISKGGMPVDPNTLGGFLGGKGHMVIISVKDKDYLHVHPEVENGNFVIHTVFSKPGIYRGWLQFQTENIIYTADFVFNVEQASQSADESEDNMHMDQH